MNIKEQARRAGEDKKMQVAMQGQAATAADTQLNAKTVTDNEVYIKENTYLNACRTYIRERFNALKSAANKLESEMQSTKAAAYSEHLEYKVGANMADNAVVQQDLWQNHLHLTDIKQEQSMLQHIYPEPYFACLDFRFADEEEVERFRLGIHSLFDEDNYCQWLIDWRSPIAALYYDAAIGPAEYAVAYDKVKGELLRKQQILIRNGEIKAIYDRSNLLHDELLEWVLSQPSGDHLQQIVATIQSEQNELIRAQEQQNILVYGVAGSGKSSIALHRVSYLFYLHPEYTAQNFLFISPNPQFAEYISELLPNLNDSNIGTSTLQELYRSILFNAASPLARFKFLVLSSAEKALFAGFDFAACLDDFLASLAKHNFQPRDLQLDELNLTAATLADLYQKEFQYLPLWQRTKAICRYLRETLRTKAFDFHADEIADELWQMQVYKDLRSVLDAFYQSAEFKTFTQQFTDSELSCLQQKVKRSSKQLDQIDELILAYIQVTFAADYDTDLIKHLLIDEAQDLLALEHLLLSKLFPCDKTICADFNQAIYWQTAADFSLQVKDFYAKQKKLLFKQLLIAYRSTAEITNFSAALLPEQEIKTVKRHGQAVTVTYLQADDSLQLQASKQAAAEEALEFTTELQKQAASSLQEVREQLQAYCRQWELSKEKVNKRLALILPSEAVLKLYEKAIKADSKLAAYYLKWEEQTPKNLISKLTDNLELPQNDQGESLTIELHTPESVKGMEFDSVWVILAGAEAYQTQLDRLRLYVACTRALHELYLFLLKRSPFITEDILQAGDK